MDNNYGNMNDTNNTNSILLKDLCHLCSGFMYINRKYKNEKSNRYR